MRGLRDVKYQPVSSGAGRQPCHANPDVNVDLGIDEWHDPSEDMAHQVRAGRNSDEWHDTSEDMAHKVRAG